MDSAAPAIELNPFVDPATMEHSNRSSTILSSLENSRPSSAGGLKSKDKKRVGFTGEEPPKTRKERPTSIAIPTRITLSPPHLSPTLAPSPTESIFAGTHLRTTSNDVLLPGNSAGRAHLPQYSAEVTNQIRAAFEAPLNRPRPAMRRGDSALSVNSDAEAQIGTDFAARQAHERGKRLERDERIRSAPTSRRPSPSGRRPKLVADNIPLDDFGVYSDEESGSEKANVPTKRQHRESLYLEASNLVQAHAKSVHPNDAYGLQSGIVTPLEEREAFLEYVPKPKRYRGGVFGSLLKLYNQNDGANEQSLSPSMQRAHFRTGSSGASYNNSALNSALSTPQHSPPGSGAVTPTGTGGKKPWYTHKHGHHSTSSLAHLVGSSAMGASPVSGLGAEVAERLRQQKAEHKRPGMGKRTSSLGRLKRREDEIRITIHIAETIARQRYLLKLCKALMIYGAPTHRLEEYMKMSARVLEIEAQFLYIPGSMIISFDDNATHTTEVKLVRVTQGLDLGKLRDTHEVYKDVVHDRVGVEEATQRLVEVMKKPQKHGKWTLIPVYGLASASVGPFAFGARPIDLPFCFVLGCILGVLQLIVSPASELYANVFEIGAAVITSFLARAFGSIGGGKYFCFSAMAQSSIALILPGFTVLCASLELQSRSIVAGSVRMVYAIIYSLFLGFGITIGTALYGIMDSNATSETTCRNSIGHHYFFIAVPIFTMCLIVVNQAKWKQAPMMMLIAFAGYVVNYFSSKRFSGNTQVSNTLGALAIGVLANLHSRIGSRVENWFLDLWEDRLRPKIRYLHKRFRGKATGLRAGISSMQQVPMVKLEQGEITDDAESIFQRRTRKVGYGLAAAAMLPAIFVQVPSGLAVSGSLVSGLAAANQISGNATNGTTVINSATVSSDALNSIAFNVSYSVIQVAIGITVGLFLSAIVVYPFGKRRSGLFSF
ncbi:hypothetical protein MBLNU459_g0957t1 [Dothideomycetes sp. NU459]